MDAEFERELRLKIRRLHAAADALHAAAAAAAGVWSGEAADAHRQEEAEAWELLQEALKHADGLLPDSDVGGHEDSKELLSSFLL